MKDKYIELAQNLQSSLHTQALIWLKLDVEWKIDRQLYDKEDIINVSILFMHVLSNISANHLINEKWMTNEQALTIVEELWKNMRQTILLWTGIDTHDIN